MARWARHFPEALTASWGVPTLVRQGVACILKKQKQRSFPSLVTQMGVLETISPAVKSLYFWKSFTLLTHLLPSGKRISHLHLDAHFYLLKHLWRKQALSYSLSIQVSKQSNLLLLTESWIRSDSNKVRAQSSKEVRAYIFYRTKQSNKNQNCSCWLDQDTTVVGMDRLAELGVNIFS